MMRPKELKLVNKVFRTPYIVNQPMILNCYNVRFLAGIKLHAPNSSIINAYVENPNETAVESRGLNNSVKGCRIRNCKNGILSEKDFVNIRRNEISEFSEDGIRYCGDYSIIGENSIHTPIAGGMKAHIDAIQSYAGDKNTPWRNKDRYTGKHELVSCEIFENIIINTNPEIPLQGYTHFDGIFRQGFIYKNQINLASNEHGITLCGGYQTTIISNTLEGEAKINLTTSRYIDENKNMKFTTDEEWCRVAGNQLQYIGRAELPYLMTGE